MQLSYHDLRLKLSAQGLWPKGRLARIAWYVLGLDLLLFVLQKLLELFKLSWGDSLGGWVSFLSLVAIVLFSTLAFRWLKAKILWRLRNRLIVTHIFIGVIPVVLLVGMAVITMYLFAGQFASFVVTSEIHSQLRSMGSVNAAFANELAARLERGQTPMAESLEGLRKRDRTWAHRQVCAWYGGKALPVCSGPQGGTPFALPSFLSAQFGEIVRDRGQLYLRAATVLPMAAQKLTVVCSEALDKDLVDKIAADLGEISLYASGFDAQKPGGPNPSGLQVSGDEKKKKEVGVVRQSNGETLVAGDNDQIRPTFIAGAVPPATGALDREITFGTPLPVIAWETGEHPRAGALVRVQTRPSVLYSRLFAALGDFAKGVEYILFFVAIFFAIIELVALLVGTRLTRAITSAVAQLYKATKHIDQGDFSHRIPVKSSDQLAELANSFNSMTASIERLIIEQKEKQRLENELVIAQEVQAQLFPKEVSQLESLEVHGFCRPARTVSGDYYDFLTVNTDKMILAAGDVSGKGISAALLMATIHSAVRAYSLEGMPRLREPVAVGAVAGTGMMMASGLSPSGEASPATLLALLNHQLYESTPLEKYATLFLALYDGASRKLTYSNGGHLPPVIISEDGTLRRLDCGGMVVGLFDNLSYEESSVQLQSGEIFLAYSDGVTEPENEYGEFGEERLIELVGENRHLPLTRITEAVTAAVDDWIGPHEQPDDVTLVLARAR